MEQIATRCKQNKIFFFVSLKNALVVTEAVAVKLNNLRRKGKRFTGAKQAARPKQSALALLLLPFLVLLDKYNPPLF